MAQTSALLVLVTSLVMQRVVSLVHQTYKTLN